MALRHLSASWVANMLSTAVLLTGRCVHPGGCRRKAVRSEEAKALEVSRYAREKEARTFAGVRTETTGSSAWMTPKRSAWPS